MVGAAKAGTTALYRYLREHPQVFMSRPKEPNYFALQGVRPAFCAPGDEKYFNSVSVYDPEAYRALFQEASNAQAVGEVSPCYLYYPHVPDRIHKTIPDARIVAILRSPMDRAFSSYLHLLRVGSETAPTFSEGLALEEERVAEGYSFLWHYRKASLYAAQLRRFLDLFGEDRVQVFLYDDFETDPARTYRALIDFLGVDASYEPSFSTRYNESKIPRSRGIKRIIQATRELDRRVGRVVPRWARPGIRSRIERMNGYKPMMPRRVRAELAEYYRDDVREVETLLGRDLEHWLRVGKA